MLSELKAYDTDRISEVDKNALISQLAELLPKLQQDPNPIIHLIEYIIRQPTFTFNRILAIKPAIDFMAGLLAPLSSINIITLRLLSKAAASRSDSEIIAGQPNVVAALINLWLRTTDTAVAQMSLQTFLGLLTAGGGISTGADESGMIDENLMWRRLFRDRDVYGSIFALCSLQTVGQDGQLSKHEKTKAQARLLDFLLEVDSDSSRRSQFPDIEGLYGVTDGGLLSFATMHMIDYADDIIMHMTLINFLADFLRSPSPMSDSSKALNFLIETGLHARTVSYYIEPLKHAHLDSNFLYGQAAKYIVAYATNCPAHLIRQSGVLESILGRLSMVLDGINSVSITQAESFRHDLQVLWSLPPAALRSRPELEIIVASIDHLDAERPVYRTGIGNQTMTIGR